MKGAKLGQHFLANKNAADKIARNFFPVKGPIIEIGPGKGVLTELLIKYREHNPLTAVEFDNTLFYKLKNKYAQTADFDVLNRDILKVDLHKQLADQDKDLNIIGNIPYYISKEIMDWVVKYHKAIGRGMFMTQKEFAEKIMSTDKPNLVNPQSIILNYLFQFRKHFDVQPGSFSPPPKVKSTVFSFETRPIETSHQVEVDKFYLFLRQSFKNRRKTLLNNIATTSNNEKLWNLFDTLHINPKIRAEQLNLDQFLSIYKTL